jgi:hypothetical protein
MEPTPHFLQELRQRVNERLNAEQEALQEAEWLADAVPLLSALLDAVTVHEPAREHPSEPE